MIAKINAFFQSLQQGTDTSSATQITLEIACTVLLCEVMLADGKLEQQERQQLTLTLEQEFYLTEQEIGAIIEQALLLCENATDFYQFTSRINAQYSTKQRVKMLELLWQVAYADGHLASIEEHIIRKIADLLHLRHSEFIETKLAVLASKH